MTDLHDDDTRARDVLDDLADGAADVPSRPRRRTARVVGWSIAGVLLAVLAVAALLGMDALRARDALARAVPLVQDVEATLAADPTASIDLTEVQDLTATARSSTDGPLWWLAARLPGIGADAHAVSTSARAVDVVTHDVLPPLLDARDGVDLTALRPVDGRVDLAPVTAAAPLVADASAALDSVLPDVEALDTTELRPMVAGPVETLRSGLATLDERVGDAHAVTSVLPALLGADGERRYLVLFLTNAELRSLGGIPGALAVLEADDGRVTLAEQASAGDVPAFTDAVPGLDAADAEIWSDRPARFVQDTTMLPDFPTAAALAATMWESSGHEAVDGVIAVDPVALSYLLEATGPVDVPGATIDASTAVDLLLNGAYRMFAEPDEQDAFFAGVSAGVFGAVLAGDVDPATLASAVERATDERRLHVWTRDQTLEDDVVALGVGGSLAAEPQTAGLFLVDGTGAKLDYYLDAEVAPGDLVCSDGTATTTVSLTLTSHVPDPAGLPWYVLGSAGAGTLEPGSVRTNVAIYSAADGSIGSVTRDGVGLGGSMYDDGEGRQVTVVTVDLAPGETTTLTVDLTGPASTAAALWTTPTARQGGSVAMPSCG